ncbi:MAG: sialidase family protein [Thermoplasmatota archaeon]
MRALAVTCVALLGALVIAGCVTPSTSPGSSNPASKALLTGGWTLDCTLGNDSRLINASWAQNCEARASHTPGPKEETWAGVNPTNPNNVVIGVKDMNPASSANCTWNDVMVTHDAGKTWKDVTIGGTFASRTPTSPYYGYDCNTDPDFRFGADGALYYGVELYGLENKDGLAPSQVPLGVGGFIPGGGKILLATSHDGGDTWPQVITYQPEMGTLTDFSRMTISPKTGTILEAIGSVNSVTQGCNLLRSADKGQTATFITVATKDGIPCNSGAQTAIAASPNGTIVIIGGQTTAEMNPTGGPAQYSPVVVRSTDDGVTWTDSNVGFSFNPINSFNESKYRVSSLIELAYDLTNGTHRGTLYAVYAASGRGGNASASNIYIRNSKDDGRTWSDPVLIDNDTTGAHQWMPNIAVAADGSLHVVYMDKQYDPNHVLIDISHAVSLDGGQTWYHERVSTVSYNGNLGKHQDGFPFIGDYLGIDATGTNVWAGFPDASNGVTTVVAAAHFQKTS